jgi:hypothetical protein
MNSIYKLLLVTMADTAYGSNGCYNVEDDYNSDREGYHPTHSHKHKSIEDREREEFERMKRYRRENLID